MIDLSNVLEIIWSWIRKGIYATILLSFFLFVGTIITGFTTVFILTFGYVQDFMTYAVTDNGSLSALFGMLSCIGFTHAFNDYKVFIIASISFLFTRIALAQFLDLFFKLLRAIEPLTKK